MLSHDVSEGLGFLIVIPVVAALGWIVFSHAEERGNKNAAMWGWFTLLAPYLAIPIYAVRCRSRARWLSESLARGTEGSERVDATTILDADVLAELDLLIRRRQYRSARKRIKQERHRLLQWGDVQGLRKLEFPAGCLGER